MPQETPEGPDLPRWRVRGSLADRLEVLLPLVGYAAVVLTGASTSSLGVPQMRQDPAHPLGTVLGTPQGIRSDEWLTQTPIELNVLSLGHSSHNSLAQSPDLVFQLSSGQPLESLFFADSTLLRLGPWLPDAMLFAAWRALPLLAVVLTLPPLLRLFGATRALSWFAVALVALAPTTLWWSFTPVRILAFASTGCYLLVLARNRWRPGRGAIWSILLAAVGGVLVARLGTYYIPWCLTVGLPVVLATSAYLVWSPARRTGLTVLAIGAAAGAVLLGASVWENWPAFHAQLETAYPGDRRSTGAAMPPFHLFGAPGLYRLQDPTVQAIPNQSEICSAFLVCLVWAAVVARRMVPTERARSAALAVLVASTCVWLAWCTISWGTWGEHLPLLNLVPPPRAAQTVGYPAALVLCLVLSRVERSSTRQALVAGAVCGSFTAYGVSTLPAAIPALGVPAVWLASLGVAVAVAAVTRFPRHWAPVSLVCVAMLATGYRVNPLNFGLGDLRQSASAVQARDLGEAAREARGTIVSDSEFVSALLVANGAPTLTGYQISGPERARWERMDPDDTYEEEWNRGASFLRMTFDGAPGSDPVVTNPNPDIIAVSVDPCSLRPAGFRVAYVVSATDLDRPCLEQVGTLTWSGAANYVFAVP